MKNLFCSGILFAGLGLCIGCGASDGPASSTGDEQQLIQEMEASMAATAGDVGTEGTVEDTTSEAPAPEAAAPEATTPEAATEEAATEEAATEEAATEEAATEEAATEEAATEEAPAESE